LAQSPAERGRNACSNDAQLCIPPLTRHGSDEGTWTIGRQQQVHALGSLLANHADNSWGSEAAVKGDSVPVAEHADGSKLVRENVVETDLEFFQDRLQFVQRQVVFSPFDPVQGRMRNTHPFAEVEVRPIAPRFTQVLGQLSIEVPPHLSTLANLP
jgi:hypothetical protein